MNRVEARRIAGDLVAELWELDRDRLLGSYGDRPRCRVVFGEGGVTYEVEIRVELEGWQGQWLRVIVTVGTGGDEPSGPVVEDFLASSGGLLATGAPGGDRRSHSSSTFSSP